MDEITQELASDISEGSLLVSFDYNGASYEAWSLTKALEMGVPAVVLAGALKPGALVAIDAAASVARGRYLTSGIGQDSTYLAKASEAEAFLQAGSPADASAYFLLKPEADARGITVADLAVEVIAARDAWHQVAGEIEGVRISGKALVTNAGTADEVQAASAQVIERLAAL